MNNKILSILPDKRTLPQSERNCQEITTTRKVASKTRPSYFLILFFFSLLTLNFSLLTYSQTAPFPTDHLQLWLRADSVELTDGKVSRWYDLSPNQYEIVQTNENARPIVDESAINNLPALQFNGTSTYLTGGDILDIGLNSWSWFIVAKYINGNYNERFVPLFLGKYDRNSNWASTYKWAISGTHILLNDLSYRAIPFVSNSDSYNIFCFELFNRQENRHKVTINSNLAASVSMQNGTNNANNELPIYIGGNILLSTSYSESFLNGEIAEIIAMNSTDSTFINQVYNYLYVKYSSTISLPQYINGICDSTISAYNPDFISYQWSTGETDSAIHVNCSGRYTVTVTNSFGVTSTDDINVYFPEVYQMHDTTICAGDTIYWNTGLDQDGYTFQWMKDGTPHTNTSNRIEIFEAGAYTCVIIDSLGCSFQTDTVHIAIDEYPISTSFIADGTCSVQTDTSLCAGNTLGLATNIDETISYLWNTGATSSRITLTETGDYSLITTNSRGCRAVNSIHVNILGEAPEINYAINNLCFGDATSFVCNAESPQDIGSYLWIVDGTDSISAQSFNYEFANTGNHNIRNIVTSYNSCRTDSSFSITIKEIAIPNFTYTPVCYGVPMDFINNSSIPEGTTVDAYTWMIGDSVVGDEANLRYTFNNSPLSVAEASVVNLTYYISLSNGCTSDTTIEVSIRSEYTEPRFVSPAYPTNGMLVSSDSITFIWNYDYDILYYNLITSSSEDFINADTIACPTNRITLASENFADSTYWKVTSYNHCLLSFESEPYFFRKTAGDIAVSSNQNLQLWLRADNVELNDGKVSRWYDFSQNNYVIQQTDESARPTINRNALNNKPALIFNGTSTYLTGGDILDLGNDGWTWFVVGQYNNGNQTGVNSPIFLGKYDRYNGWATQPLWTLGKEIWLIFWNPTQNQLNFSSNITSNYFTFFCYEILERIKKSSTIYNNNENIISNVYNGDFGDYSNSLSFKIGQSVMSSTAPNGNFLNGQIAEIIAFNTVDSTLRNQVYDYIYTKYVATVSLGLDIHTTSFCDTAITTAYNPEFISYLWSTGETDSVIHVSQSGHYTVTVTNSFGVTSTDNINVYFPEVLQMQDTTICTGDTIIWNTKLPQNAYSFQWYKDSLPYGNAQSVQIFEAGAYNCIITDTLGCTFATDTMHLSIDNYTNTAGFGGTDGWPSISTDTTLCYGNRLHITSGYSETASAIWQDGNTNLEYFLTQNGTYTVTTTNTRGCQAVNTINVTLQGQVPTPNFSIDGHCQNAQIEFTDLSYSTVGDISTRKWYANDSLIGDTENILHSFAEYGQQSVKLFLATTDQCQNDTTIYFYIDPQPQPDFMPKFFCQNAETEINAQSSIYEGEIVGNTWNIQGETLYGDNIRATFTGTELIPVQITAESAAGCSGTRIYEVVVRQTEKPAMDISGLCLGSGTAFTNETPFSNTNPQIAWEWDFGDNTATSARKNPTHYYTTTGNYNISLSVTFANHCTTRTDTTISIFSQPEVSIITSNGCIGGQTEMLADISTDDHIYNYRWSIGDIYESNEAQPIFVADSAGVFPVSFGITTDHMCTAEATGTLNIHGQLNVSFRQSRDWGGNPLYVEFENTSEGVSSYHWDFGGAGESSQTNPYFIFTEPGTYEVTLTGTNEHGCFARYTAESITVVEPIVDIMLMNLSTKEENGFTRISLIVVNVGTLPVEDLILELKVNGLTYRETIEHIAQGAVVPHTFGTMIPIPHSADINTTICVEALVPDTEGHADMDLSNNSICVTGSDNLSVGNPYPIPASEQITCDIYTKSATDLDIAIFSIFGKLVKPETISHHKGYLKYVVNVSELSAGMYFIRVIGGDERITNKFEVR